MDFLLILGCVAIVYFLFNRWMASVKAKLEAELLHAAAVDTLRSIIFIRIEEHTDMKFAYNAMTSEFLVQGRNLDELTENFGKSFPKSRGVLIESEEKINVL